MTDSVSNRSGRWLPLSELAHFVVEVMVGAMARQTRAQWRRCTLLGQIGLTLLALSACGGRSPVPVTPAAQAAAPTATTITVVAMGDSLTEGLGVDPNDAYPAQLERKLQANGYAVTVINAGNSGETSSGALSRVDWVLTLHPQILILATGGNDGLRGIDPKLTEQNIGQIVHQFQQKDVIVILAGMEMVQNMGKEYTDAFHAIYPAVAKQYNTIFVPFLLEGVATKPDLNQSDFVHPNAKGYTVVIDTLYPYVVEAISKLK